MNDREQNPFWIWVLRFAGLGAIVTIVWKLILPPSNEIKVTVIPATSTESSSYKEQEPLPVTPPEKSGDLNHNGDYPDAKIVESVTSHSAKYVSTSLNQNGITEIGITIIDESNKLSHDLINGVANYYKLKQMNSKNNIFTPAFIAEKKFQDLYNGNLEYVNTLNISDYCDKIAIGLFSINFRENSQDPSMSVASCVLNLKIITTESPTIENSVTIQGISTGWSENEAKSNAIREIISQLDSYL